MRQIKIGHSPDADDAYMFYAITHGIVNIEGPEPSNHTEVLEDIQSLNARALMGELEMTAISAALYPQVADRYRILSCGASMGLGYGPIVVVNRERSLQSLKGGRVAMPGVNTTAFMLSKMFLPEVEAVQLPFDTVMNPVASGEVDAAVVIHEGQLTYVDAGLTKILDLGEKWHAETGLPLPLGLDCVQRDLGDEWHAALDKALRASIAAAFENNADAVNYALQFGRGIDAARGEKFAKMYVNELTVDMGAEGEAALIQLYSRAHRHGIISEVPQLDIVRGADA